MRTYSYAAAIQEGGPDDFVLTFRDIPEAITGGASWAQAFANAPDCLAAAVEHYLAEGLPLPEPTLPEGAECAVALEPALAARAALASEMAARKISKVGLAQLMGRNEKTVRRILSGKDASLDLVIEAMHAIGLRPAITV